MSLQATLDRFKEIQVSGKEFRTGGVGLLAGLLLGLLIGWVLWPVEWQGGDVNALSRDAQVAYVGAVADAYAGATSSSALDLARQRLAPLQADLAALFDEAIARAVTQPDNATQIANLALLASSMGVAISAELPTVATPTADASPASSGVNGAGSDGDNGGSIWRFLLLSVLSIVALGGGAYLGWRYFFADKMRQDSDATALPPRNATTATAPGAIDAYAADAAPQRLGGAPYRTAQAAATKVTPVQPPTMGDVPPFEDDELSQAATPSPVKPPPTTPRSAPSSLASSSPASSSQTAFRQGASSFSPSVAVPASAMTNPLAGFTEDDDLWEEAGVDSDEGGSLEEAPPLAHSPAATAQRASAPGWMAGAGRLERYQTIDHFHAEFTVGMQNFDWTQHIQGVQDGVYAGEYGAGVSERHGMLNNDPEQVVAIEVYIFDKSDEKHLVNVSRVVLSEYADTHLRKQFEREKDRLGPIVAQPNTTLQLETRQFVLICTITDVVYSDEGIFKRVIMDMELKKKN